MYLAELRGRAGRPAPVGVVGVGRMGRGIVDQVATMTGLQIGAADDREGDRALRAFTENGWERDRLCVTDDLGTAVGAVREGRAVATEDPLLLPHLPLEVVVEATGDPTTGALVAEASIAHGHHTVMLDVDTSGPPYAMRQEQNRLFGGCATGWTRCAVNPPASPPRAARRYSWSRPPRRSRHSTGPVVSPSCSFHTRFRLDRPAVTSSYGWGAHPPLS